MILKAACTHCPGYVDHLLTLFVRCFHKLVKEQVQSSQSGQTNSESNPGTCWHDHLILKFFVASHKCDCHAAIVCELTIICLDLIKHRVGAMNAETRRTFIHVVLVQIVERATEVKLIWTVVRTLDEWLKVRLQDDLIKLYFEIVALIEINDTRRSHSATDSPREGLASLKIDQHRKKISWPGWPSCRLPRSCQLRLSVSNNYFSSLLSHSGM